MTIDLFKCAHCVVRQTGGVARPFQLRQAGVQRSYASLADLQNSLFRGDGRVESCLCLRSWAALELSGCCGICGDSDAPLVGIVNEWPACERCAADADTSGDTRSERATFRSEAPAL